MLTGRSTFVENKPDPRKFYKGNLTWLVDNTIFLTLHGSHAYGTNTPSSDVDVKGIAIPPTEYYLGFSKGFEQAEFKDPDGVVYEIRKFFKLARDCNPNIIEVLHTDESDWISVHPVGRKIIENRHIFMSKKAYYTFFGYARAQLKRINTHYRWLKNPPKAPMTRAEFGLPERPILPPDQLSAAMADIQKKVESWDINWDLIEPSERIGMQERLSLQLAEVGLAMDSRWVPAAKLLGYDDNFILYVQKEREYKTKCADWDSYQEWKKSRNPQRAVLEEKFGYDTKHGMHLVRLIRMCREILTTGEVLVKRPDREELLAIRNGALPYEEMVEWADKQENELATVYQTSTALPKTPDERSIDALCEDSIRSFLRL
jgi:predicted nucleotidyltransferase